MKVQIDYVNGKQGMYECTKRPYFNYDNNTVSLTLDDKTIIVVNMLQIISISYPDTGKN